MGRGTSGDLTPPQRLAADVYEERPAGADLAGEEGEGGRDPVSSLSHADVEGAKAGNPAAIKRLLTRELIDALAPKHGRTSCSDSDSHGNEYAPEHGVPRCTRCALLALLRRNDGKGPYGEDVTLAIDIDVRYDGDRQRAWRAQQAAQSRP